MKATDLPCSILRDSVSCGPTLYHLSAEGSWPGIQRHGLLSSKLILNKFGIDEKRLREIETHRLSHAYPLHSEEYGSFVLRDRTTLSHAELTYALQGSCSSDHWINLLSQRVFLFAQKKSLENLLKAPLNCKLSHVVLEVETCKLFDRHASVIEVAEINNRLREAQTGTPQPSYLSVSSQLHQNRNETDCRSHGPEQHPEHPCLCLRSAVLRRPDGTEELLYST